MFRCMCTCSHHHCSLVMFASQTTQSKNTQSFFRFLIIFLVAHFPSLSSTPTSSSIPNVNMSSHALPDSVKCLDGVDYEVVKHNAHFEWVTGYENTIKRLASDVFDTAGVTDGSKLDVAVRALDAFQDGLKTKMDTLVQQVAGRPGSNERAKSFAAEWAEACKYQVDLKYHRMGGGPTAQSVRWSFESAIKYIVICATHLADQRDDNDVEFAVHVSDYVRTVVIQSLIDSLENVKSELKAIEKDS